MRKLGAQVAERLTHFRVFYKQRQIWLVGSVLQEPPNSSLMGNGYVLLSIILKEKIQP